MPGGKKTIFNPAMDKVIKEVYPKKGGVAATEAVNESFNADYTLKQIHSRARVLHLSAPANQGGTAEPRYLQNVESKEPVGIYQILEYYGYQQKDVLFKGHHWYKVRCNCGFERKMMQESIYQAKLRGIKNCQRCAKSNKLTDAEERAIRLQREKEAMQKWIETMKLMPPIDWQIVPFEKRFDSQRLL